METPGTPYPCRQREEGGRGRERKGERVRERERERERGREILFVLMEERGREKEEGEKEGNVGGTAVKDGTCLVQWSTEVEFKLQLF